MQRNWRNEYEYRQERLKLKKRTRGKAYVHCYSCGKILYSGDMVILEIKKKGGKITRKFCAEIKNGKYCHESIPFSPSRFTRFA